MSNESQTKKVNIELEVDTSIVDSSKNRYQGLIDLSIVVGAGAAWFGLYTGTSKK